MVRLHDRLEVVEYELIVIRGDDVEVDWRKPFNVGLRTRHEDASLTQCTPKQFQRTKLVVATMDVMRVTPSC